MQRLADAFRSQGQRIALVPTMGALHEGHLTLIRRAKTSGAVVVVSVFVNPVQFGAGEDFDRYPRDLDRDRQLASNAGAMVVFAPSVGEMYPAGYHTYVDVEKLTDVLEGRARPGHFRGVTTVVAKLFLCTKPHAAYFGQKDAQQAAVIRRMAADLHFDLDLVVVPTVREADGLALSSRNAYLTPAQRTQAPVLFRALEDAAARVRAGERDPAALRDRADVMIRTQPDARPEYIAVSDADTLDDVTVLRAGQTVIISLAVRFGTTRLIDNVLVDVPRDL
jgi:pantoate--beta-alanine ligase